jgi:hypothetical protein
MSRARRHARVEMGEAISFEDVLTVITVLLLLRLVFMVPLINLDKAKTISARKDAYWSLQAGWLLAHPGESAPVKAYRNAFDLDGKTTLLTGIRSGNAVYLEAAATDSNMLVIRHNLSDSSFIAMHVHGINHSMSFRLGKLLWSQSEAEWFPAADIIDYGMRPESKAMEKEFRTWTRKHRGY